MLLRNTVSIDYRILIEFSADVDECTTGDHDCDENAICEKNTGLSTTGPFSCSCKGGYYGDGKTCLDQTIGKNY